MDHFKQNWPLRVQIPAMQFVGLVDGDLRILVPMNQQKRGITLFHVKHRAGQSAWFGKFFPVGLPSAVAEPERGR